MKKVILVAIAALWSLFAVAQQAKEADIKVGKKSATGYVATSKYSRDEIFNALTGKLNNAGVKKYKIKKKFYICKEIVIPEISSTKLDIYFKVTAKKSRSKIYFLVSKGYDNYITSASDQVTSANIVQFLSQLEGIVEYNRDVAKKEEEIKEANAKIEAQKESVKRAEDEKARKAKELEDMKKGKNNLKI